MLREKPLEEFHRVQEVSGGNQMRVMNAFVGGRGMRRAYIPIRRSGWQRIHGVSDRPAEGPRIAAHRWEAVSA